METGEKFNSLTCIGKDEEKDQRYYLFRCDCGRVKSIIADNVKNGRTKSCGCRKNKRNIRHGGSGSRLYTIWKSMRERCNNPNTNRHSRYFDRGIRVCDDWDRFEIFRDWALKNGYEDNLSIDRINGDGPYSPENCRWVTNKEQQNNRSNTIHVEYGGEIRTISEWSNITGVQAGTIRSRLRSGKSAGEALGYEK